MTKTIFNYWEKNNKQQTTELHKRQLYEQNPGAEGSMYTCIKQRGTIVHIFTILPQFCITIFISKLVRIHAVLSFQNKHKYRAIYGPQCETLTSHLRVRMNKVELKRYQLGTSWKCFPICVGLQNKMHMFRE